MNTEGAYASLTENEFIISSSLELMIRKRSDEQDKGNSFFKKMNIEYQKMF